MSTLDPTKLEHRPLIITEAFRKLIAEDAYFTGEPAVPVLTERDGDINAMVNAALARLGLCVVVIMAEAERVRAAGDRLVLQLRLVAEISEKVLLNKGRSGSNYRPALSAAFRAARAVHEQPNGLDTDVNGSRVRAAIFELDEQHPVRLMPHRTDIIYHVTAHTAMDL